MPCCSEIPPVCQFSHFSYAFSQQQSATAHDRRLSKARKTRPMGENIQQCQAKAGGHERPPCDSRVYCLDSDTEDTGRSAVHLRLTDTGRPKRCVGVQ